MKSTGTLDSSFAPLADSGVYALAVQPDGKIVVGGSFTALGGQARNLIGRLNADGSLDTSFNPGATGPFPSYVSCLMVQADGKILVGGRFTSLGGQSRFCVGRLESNGSLDTGFTPPALPTLHLLTGANAITIQSDGTILVCGAFIEQPTMNRLVRRLNPDGTLRANLCWSSLPLGQNEYVLSAALLADGRVCVGGYFSSLNGQSFRNLARLYPDGSLETTFSAGAGGPVFSLGVQADGKLMVAGGFTTLAGGPRSNLGRLNDDASLDASFNPGASNPVYALTIQADGKILAGGDFATIGNRTRSRIARLNNTAAATQELT